MSKQIFRLASKGSRSPEPRVISNSAVNTVAALNGDTLFNAKDALGHGSEKRGGGIPDYRHTMGVDKPYPDATLKMNSMGHIHAWPGHVEPDNNARNPKVGGKESQAYFQDSNDIDSVKHALPKDQQEDLEKGYRVHTNHFSDEYFPNGNVKNSTPLLNVGNDLSACSGHFDPVIYGGPKDAASNRDMTLDFSQRGEQPPRKTEAEQDDEDVDVPQMANSDSQIMGGNGISAKGTKEAKGVFEKLPNKVLTAAARKKIKPQNFALPGGRYPMNDANHARAALSMVSQFGTR